MIRSFIFLILFSGVPFFVFAQEGSTGARQDVPTEATAATSAPRTIPKTSAPRAETLSPSVAVPTPSATAPLENAPESASSMTSPPETMPIPPEENSNTSLYIISALAAAILAGLGAYQFRSKKVKQDSKKEKKDDRKCLNLKKMMEDKLKELADLRGQIESKAKEKAREKIRGSLAGTSAGEVLGKIEAAEKEYARLKRLYEKCVIEFSRKKTILVDAVHSFVDTQGKIFKEMHDLLEKYQNRKILLTGADDRQFKEWSLGKMPYEVFTLKHNPEKASQEYYKKMLAHFGLNAREVIYFEHSADAVKSAESIGIKTYFFDSTNKDLKGLKKFLDENIK